MGLPSLGRVVQLRKHFQAVSGLERERARLIAPACRGMVFRSHAEREGLRVPKKEARKIFFGVDQTRQNALKRAQKRSHA